MFFTSRTFETPALGGETTSSFFCLGDASPPSVYLGRHNVVRVIKWTRPSPSIFACCKRSKTGRWEGLGVRLDDKHSSQTLARMVQSGTLPI